jgi:hypothetical protein
MPLKSDHFTSTFLISVYIWQECVTNHKEIPTEDEGAHDSSEDESESATAVAKKRKST